MAVIAKMMRLVESRSRLAVLRFLVQLLRQGPRSPNFSLDILSDANDKELRSLRHDLSHLRPGWLPEIFHLLPGDVSLRFFERLWTPYQDVGFLSKAHESSSHASS